MGADDLVAHIESMGEHIKAMHMSIPLTAAAQQFNVSEATIRRRAAAAGIEISGGFLHLEIEDNCSNDTVPF